MKAFKRIATTSFTALAIAVIGSTLYNSAAINNDSFMVADLGTGFNKRLDEIDGKVVVGRMAASTRKWSQLNPVEEKRERKEAIVLTGKGVQKVATKKIEEELEPTIKEDLNLSLTSAFFKKPLKKGSVTGSAVTVDGVIEEIFVNLPDGNVIEINTYDRMIGNVFQYDDSLTGERKSGMFYESGKNKFTIVLTNDTNYQGMKLEFNAGNNGINYNEDYNNNNQNWGMNSQNDNTELAAEEVLEKDNEPTEYVENENADQNNYSHNFNS